MRGGRGGCPPRHPGAQRQHRQPAHASCLVSHLDASGGAGSRRDCRKLKPAGGIGPLLLELSSCLPAHGVALPSASPGTGAGDALRYLGTIADGSPAQQSAFRSCESGL
jgi:hypothetical protein